MRVIIDVGCHQGQEAFHWCSDSSVIVHSFEPNPALYAKLKEREKEYGNFRVYPFAICEVNGEMEFHINDNDCTSSLRPFTTTQRCSYTVNTICVPTKRLDTFFQEQGITSIDLLKSDAQGSDLDVLKSCGQMIGIVKEIVVEAFITPPDLQVYENEVKADQVMDYLTSHGFVFVGQNIDGDYADMRFKRV